MPRRRLEGYEALRVIVAADSALLRAGLARLLEDAGIASSRRPAIARSSPQGRAYRPDVAVVSLDDTPSASTTSPS